MAQQAVVIEKFPGLDLRADPGDSRFALDALNVTLEQGRVRTRTGTSLGLVTTGVPVFADLNARGVASHLIVATQGAPGNLYAADASDVVLGSTTLADVRSNGATGVAIGTPSAEYYYVTSPYGGSVMKRWDGTTWTSPAGFPAAVQVLAHNQTDNRLVACVGTKVSFSDPGAPETFGANNYVNVGVGDGEQIHGAAWFNNQLFIFKRTKFYVFYGTGVDSTGEPVFNFRSVNAGVGMATYAPQAVCTGVDGVYFIGGDGVYRTTGGPPVKVSAPLDPFFGGPAAIFRGEVPPTWTGGVWDDAIPGRVLWADDKLHVAVSAIVGGVGTVRCAFVFDAGLNAWTLSGQATYAIAQMPFTSFGLNILYGGPVGCMFRQNVAVATDADTTGAPVAFSSRYRTAFESMGSPLRKRVREAILEGTGTPTLQWATDWGQLEAGAAVSLGAGPSPATQRRRYAPRGRQFSLQVGAASGAWSVNRIQVNVDQPGSPPAVVAR